MKNRKNLDSDYQKINKDSKIIDYFSLKKMKEEIYNYGYTYSNKMYALMILASICVTLGFAVLYRLKPFCIAVVMITILGCVPSLIKARFKGAFQEKKFNEVDIYLHQMAFSFQKNPKIITALEDTSKVATGKLKKVLDKAIESINNSTSSRIYDEAFEIIQKAYNNSRVIALHKFMLKIETNGGKYSTALNIMLTDIDNWVNRTYLEQKNVKDIKKITMIGLVIGYAMGAFTIFFSKYMNSSQSLMTTQPIEQDFIYQMSSLIFICISVLFFTYTQSHYNYDWVTKTKNEKKIMDDYKSATEFDANKFRKKNILLYVIILLVAVAVALIDVIPYHKYISIGIVLLDIYMVISPSFTKKSAMNRTKLNIQEAFGEWLRDVSINLQDEPLMSAIQDTYETCPVVIKPELTIFLTRVINEPTAVEPYYEFLARFKILDINSAIRNMYSLSNADIDSADEQLNQLVERNYEIINKTEMSAMESSDAMMRFTEYIPVTLASFKMGADMLSLITTML